MKILEEFITLLKTPQKGDKSLATAFIIIALLLVGAGYYYSPLNYIRAVIFSVAAFHLIRRNR